MHAYAVDGMSREQIDLFDEQLTRPAAGEAETPVVRRRQQRQAQEKLMASMQKARPRA